MERTVRASGLFAAVAIMTACGAAPARSSGAYGYGDMFATETVASGAYRGAPSTMMPMEEERSAAEPAADYGGRDYDAEMPAPAPSRPSPAGSAYSFADDVVEGALGSPPPAPPRPAPAAPPRQLAEAAVPTPPEGGEAQPAAVADAGSSGPLLIYEATLHLAVHEVREKMVDVVAIADELGGFLQRQDDTTIVIRVPSARFRDALGRVEAVGDVLSRRVSAEDVSERFRDIRIRLRNALEMRDRMAELLQRADTVPDSLTIQRELERLTQEIELYRGQLRALEDRIAFSTITVLFQPIRLDAEVPREQFRLPFPWLDRLGLPTLMELR